jgi:hypothetical protein
MKLNRAKRKAASKVLLAAFGILNTVANSTLALWPSEAWSETFTEKERAYLERIRIRVHDDGELVRKLAHRLSA